MSRGARDSVARRCHAAFFAAAREMLAVLSPDGVFIDCNRALCSWLGYAREDIIGREMARFVSEADSACLQTAYERLGLERQRAAITVRVRGGSGAELAVTMQLGAVTDEAGVLVGHHVEWCPVAAAAQEHPSATERLYCTLIDSIPYAIWMSDLSGRIIYCNQAMAELAAMSSEQMRGADWLAFLSGDQRQSIATIREAAHLHGNAYRGECQFHLSDGTVRYMYFIDTPVRDHRGEITSWLGIHVDISELKAAYQEIERALGQSNSELAQFAYAASHDLQEPLRMVTSYTQLLKQRYGTHLDERANKYINYAVDGAKRIRKLILDVLALSSVSMDGKPLRPICAHGIVDEVVTAMREDLQEYEAEIIYHRLPVVQGDPSQLRELFHCLISNSIKFRSLAPPRVEIKVRRLRASWIFTIRDNGKGFDSNAYGERIFQMFQRLHTRDKYPGTGIGLTIARKIVERHGGSISVFSEPDKGATFTLSLPAVEVEEIVPDEP